MAKRLRWLVSVLLLPFFVFWTVSAPRQAYAFAPVGAAPIAIVGTLASGIVVPVLVGVTISGLAYLAFKDLIGLGEVRVPAREGASGAVPAPAAVVSQPANAGSCSYSGPYGNVTGMAAWISAQNVVSQSAGPSCQKFHAGTETAAPTCSFTYSIWSDGVSGCPGTLVGNYSKGGGQTYSCPAGYTLVNTTCNLVNARAAVDDGKQDFTRSGGAFSPISDDLAGTLSGTRMTTNSANDTVAVSGKDANGNPVQGKIIAKADGGSKVEIKTQKVASNGSTYVETQNVETDSNGDVVSSNQTASAGSLSYDPSSKVYTEVAAPAGTLSPLTSGSGGTQTVTFPSDYARQGEAATAATSITTGLGPKLDAITQTGTDPADPLQPAQSEFDQSYFNGTFTNLLAWQLPAHTSQCPTSSFTWNSATYTIDAHCQLVSNHFSGFSSVMSVVWTIVALFVLLGA